MWSARALRHIAQCGRSDRLPASHWLVQVSSRTQLYRAVCQTRASTLPVVLLASTYVQYRTLAATYSGVSVLASPRLDLFVLFLCECVATIHITPMGNLCNKYLPGVSSKYLFYQQINHLPSSLKNSTSIIGCRRTAGGGGSPLPAHSCHTYLIY